MSRSPPANGTRRAWFALLLPAFAWMSFEYGLASALRGGCDAVGRWLGPAWGVASLIACAVAFVVARPLARGVAGGDAPTRAWLARIASFAAAIFALAIGFQTLATLIVPSCAR